MTHSLHSLTLLALATIHRRPVARRPLLVAIWLLASIVLAGCAQHPQPISRVDAITVIPSSVAMRDPKQRGPSGLLVGVEFYNFGMGGSMPVRGDIVIAVFPGHLKSEAIQADDAFAGWAFQAEDVQDRLDLSRTGWGYFLKLPWGDRTLQGAKYTVVVQHRSPLGEVVTSDPVWFTIDSY